LKRKHIEYFNDVYEVKVAKSVEEVEALRPVWERMQWHPNADIDFYLTILDTRPEIIRPHVLLLSSDGQPESMLIGRIEETRVDFKIGYKTIYSPKIRLLTCIYGGFLGSQSYPGAQVLVEELMNSLKQRDVDAVFLGHLRFEHHIYNLMRTKAPFMCRDYISFENMHWQMSLPDRIDDFFKKMSRGRRHEIRRYPKVLEKTFPGQVNTRCFQDKNQMDSLCDDIEEIAINTYQRGLGAGFIDNEENRRRLKLLAEKGCLRAYLLYVADKPCAFWIGTLYKDIFYLDFTGFDSAYRKYEPGTILFVNMVQDLIENRIAFVDFGFGDALYKERFGDLSWREVSLYIFAQTAKGMRINAIRTLIVLVSKYTKLALEKTKLVGKIKKIWRTSLSES
jgi:hypothetical protein